MPSMMIDEAVLDRVKPIRSVQRELADDAPEDDRVYTLEDEFNAGDAPASRRAAPRLAKEEAKAKKEAEELAVEEWRQVHLQVRLARQRGQW